MDHRVTYKGHDLSFNDEVRSLVDEKIREDLTRHVPRGLPSPIDFISLLDLLPPRPPMSRRRRLNIRLRVARLTVRDTCDTCATPSWRATANGTEGLEMPADATINGDGFRIYGWEGGDTPLNREYNAVAPQDLLSVTSIKSLAGMHFRLVNWQIANVVNLAMGVRKITTIGPRGGVNEKYVADGPEPGEFVSRMLDVKGDQKKRDATRRWLRATADEPRDIAAVRGSVVHKMIEDRLPVEIGTKEAIIRQAFAKQWAQERRKVKPDVLPDDVHFVGNGLRQYWDMRATMPFVILAQEPQVFNLTAGYGGSADVLIWFLGQFIEEGEGYRFEPLPGIDSAAIERWQDEADAGRVTIETIEEVGGFVALGDWKTSKGVYTGHVIQTIAYMAGEFVAKHGLIDVRLSNLLSAANLGLVIHIRPDHWEVDLFPWRDDIAKAFFGSVQYARFLAFYQTPQALFLHTLTGKAAGTEESEVTDDDAE